MKLNDAVRITKLEGEVDALLDIKEELEAENKSFMYIVEALRWGDREKHSYIIGIYDSKREAIRNALAEEYWRNGKYECSISEIVPNSFESEKIDYLVSCVGSREDMEEKIDLRLQLIEPESI